VKIAAKGRHLGLACQDAVDEFHRQYSAEALPRRMDDPSALIPSPVRRVPFGGLSHRMAGVPNRVNRSTLL